MAATFIDGIKPLRGHLVGLYAGGELVCEIDSDLAAERSIVSGREYTIDELRRLLTESQRRRARSKGLYLLGFRDYSARDLHDRLRKDFDGDSVDAAMEYLTAIGAIDDARYAGNMVRYLTDTKHYGRRRIMQELSAKGIERAIAEEAMAEYDIDERGEITGLLRGKFSRQLSDESGVRRTVNTLLRYGYAIGDIMAAINAVRSGVDEE